MKFIIFLVISTCCLLSCASRPDLNVKVKPYAIPLGRYHCYLRISASCFHRTRKRSSLEMNDPVMCTNPIAYGFFKLSPLINCTEDDLACWKSCNDTFKSPKFIPGPELATPIFHNVEYAKRETFDPITLNLTWSPVKGADFYVVQYFDTLDIFSTWDVGSGRPMITSFPYLIFTKENICSNYKFRVAAVSASHVSEFSNVLRSPDDYPKDVRLKMSLSNITVDGYKQYEKERIQVQLNFSNPLLQPYTLNSKEGRVRERAYIRGAGDVYVELEEDPTAFTNRTVHYLLPKYLLNSSNEILFVRQDFNDSCDREVMANTAVKIIFTCSNGVHKSCPHREHYDLMESRPPYFDAEQYHKRSLLALDESGGVGGLVKTFHEKVNITHYESMCDIEKPTGEPEEIFTLHSYQTVTYCGIAPPTDEASIIPKDPTDPMPVGTKIDSQLTNGQKSEDDDDDGQFYTIRISKTGLALFYKLGLVFLCILIALAFVGLSMAGFKWVRVKRTKSNNAILTKSSVKLPYSTMPKEGV